MTIYYKRVGWTVSCIFTVICYVRKGSNVQRGSNPSFKRWNSTFERWNSTFTFERSNPSCGRSNPRSNIRTPLSNVGTPLSNVRTLRSNVHADSHVRATAHDQIRVFSQFGETRLHAPNALRFLKLQEFFLEGVERAHPQRHEFLIFVVLFFGYCGTKSYACSFSPFYRVVTSHQHRISIRVSLYIFAQ